MGVLLIDDDEGIRRLLVRELARGGLEVDAAASGEEGLARLDRGGADVVVCDVRMPDLDGLEVLRRIKERAPDTTEVVMLTGHGTIDSAIEAVRAGAYHYLTKPVKVAELAAVIRNAAERAALRRDNVLLRREVGRRAPRETTAVLGESPAWPAAASKPRANRSRSARRTNDRMGPVAPRRCPAAVAAATRGPIADPGPAPPSPSGVTWR
jgi:DNA-binding NtrC family response regulator